MKGFDTTDYIGDRCGEIVKAGYSFVIKYVNPTKAHPDKAWNLEEFKHARECGLNRGVIYEGLSTTKDYFTALQGHHDGLATVADLSRLGAPAGACGFFAVDYDADPADIHDYAVNFRDVMHGAGYLVGVYGSGAVLSYLLPVSGGLGLAHYGWLAESQGWQGYAKGEAIAHIIQHNETAFNFDSDVDTAFTFAWAF